MDRLLVDTNIVIDLLAKRKSFWQEAQHLFTLADLKKVELCVSTLTLANTHYVLARSMEKEEARNALSRFKVLVTVLPMDQKIIDLALASNFEDFEDGIQYFTALESRLDAIVTRNLKDFKTSLLPIFTAKTYLDR